MNLAPKSKHHLIAVATIALSALLLTATAGYASGSTLSKISSKTLSKYNLTLADATKFMLAGTKATPASGGSTNSSVDPAFAAALKCLPVPTPNYLKPNAVGEVDSPTFDNTPFPGFVMHLSSSAYPSSGNGEAEAAKLPALEACIAAPIKALFVAPSGGVTLSLKNFSGSVMTNPNLPKGAYALKYTGDLSSGTVNASFEMLNIAVGHGNAVATYALALTKLNKSAGPPDYTQLENVLCSLIKSEVSKVGRSAL